MTARRFALLCSALLTLGTGACSPPRETATITVDPGKTFQTIESWEATAKLWEFDRRANRFDGSWLPVREQILTAMIEEGGINRLRLEIRSGAENPVDYWEKFRAGRLSHTDFRARYYEKINDNDDPRVLDPKGIQFSELDFRVENLILPAMKIAERLGRPMSFYLCYVDFDWTQHKGQLSHADNPDEYAELIAATYTHLKQKYGLVPEALEIVLEPENSDGWHGAQIGKAIVAVTQRLAEDGIEPRIIAPSASVARKTPRYFDEISGVPGAVEKISILSYHRYGSKPSDQILGQIAERAREHGARTGMLEYTHSDIDDLIADLIHANVSSWQKYGIAMLDKGSDWIAPGNMLRVTDPTQGASKIDLLPGSIPLAQIFRAVDPGAKRIAAQSNEPWVKTVAFANPDGRMVVAAKARQGSTEETLIMLHRRLNTPAPAPSEGQWTIIKGMKAGRYLVRRSNWLDSDALRCIADLKPGEDARVFLRGGDAITLVEQGPDARLAGEKPCARYVDHWE